MARILVAGAAAFALTSAWAAGGGWSELLGRVPALPAAVADAARRYDPAEQRWRDGKASSVLDELVRRQAGASGGGSGGPGMSAEDGEALARRMEGMSQEQQIAFAMQMQQQMGGGAMAMGGAELSARDQELADALQSWMDGGAARNEQGRGLAQKVQQMLPGWDPPHDALREQYRAKGDALGECDFAGHARVEREHKQAQAALAARHLGQARAVGEQHRALIAKVAGFLDAHTPDAAQLGRPPIRLPHDAATQHAAMLLTEYFGTVEQLYRYAAPWNDSAPLGLGPSGESHC